MSIVEIRHWHMCFGLGGGAKGFNAGEARVGPLEARFRCIGGVDVDPAGARDFRRLAGTDGTVLDLFSRDQYMRSWRKSPPEGWREATPSDLRQSAGGERPHIVFTSMPCKAFSGLLSESKSKTDRYVALSELTLRGVWLLLEAWGDDPPELIVFENVPRIATRGRYLLDQIIALLRQYGYAVAETTHDCGELGSLAQSRKRFLLVARHAEKVPPFLYEPPKRPLRAVGDLLGRMPLPGDALCGPMHRIPSLQMKTWIRLALVEAGSDWRSLNKLEIQDGVLRDYILVPESSDAWHPNVPGVNSWDRPPGTVADPRHLGPPKHSNEYRIVRWNRPSCAVTGAHGSGQAVADPRQSGPAYAKYAITEWDSASGTVIAGSTTGQGAFAVADPRSGLAREQGDAYVNAGHYGVVPWASSSGAVSGAACHDNGPWSVADPRMPAPNDKLIARIRALDGTWHRPFTTMELAVLQSLIEPEEQLDLDGLSDSAWRERIGNAVPPAAAKAIASEMGRTLLLAWSGETFLLNDTPIWVRPVAVGLSVAQLGAV